MSNDYLKCTLLQIRESMQKIFFLFLNENIPRGHMALIQRHLNVDATSLCCIDVEPTLYKRPVPAGICCWYLLEAPWRSKKNK